MACAMLLDRVGLCINSTLHFNFSHPVNDICVCGIFNLWFGYGVVLCYPALACLESVVEFFSFIKKVIDSTFRDRQLY